MSVPMIVSGCLALLAAGLHGVGGEVFVIRRLPLTAMPSSPFGGPRTTKTMLHVSWHMVTVAFLTVGLALIVAGSTLEGAVAQGIGVVGAAATTGFALLAAGFAVVQAPQAFLRHPAPLVLGSAAALAWWGAL